MSKEKVARFNKQHFVVGLKETLKALKKDQVTSLIIAEDVEVYLMTRVLSQINQKIYLYLFSKANMLWVNM
ncbi:50S ribosomal protein L7A [Staphylococcus aureus M39274]|nr:50S ribosomal protein L7A [Staphylococcus aureus M39274]